MPTVIWSVNAFPFQIQAQIRYERACKEAALSRLKLAVAEIQHTIDICGCTCHESYTSRKLEDPTCGYHNYEIEGLEDVLKAIGSLPNE